MNHTNVPGARKRLSTVPCLFILRELFSFVMQAWIVVHFISIHTVNCSKCTQLR